MAYSKEFCSRYGAYDNSGLLLDCKNEVKAAVFALDLSKDAVKAAEKSGAGAIVTHHPAIYSKLASLSADDETSGAVLAAARAGISVISMHLNLDAAEGGIDESLARAVRAAGGKAAGKAAERCGEPTEDRMFTFSCGNGEALDGTLGGRHTLLFANEGKTVKRAASFCGAGADEEAIAFAAKNGADALISSDFKHHILKEAVSRGMAVIAPTHYASENYGFYQFYLKVQKIAGTAGVVCEYFENSALL